MRFNCVNMKKSIIILSSLFLAFTAQAFSFGDLVKKASATTEQSAVEKSLIAKQESAIVKYRESKTEFLKGFSIIADEIGAANLKQTADNALSKIDAQKIENFDADVALKATTDVATIVQSKELVDAVAKTASTKSAVDKYTDSLSHLKTAVEGELEAAKIVKDLAVEVRDAIKNASSNAEKLKLAASLKPSLELAQTIPADISGAKNAITSILPILKTKGVNASSDLLSLLGR